MEACMAKYEIHPGIGIARLGNHDGEYFIAAEPRCDDPAAYYERQPVARCDRDVPRDSSGAVLAKYRANGELLRQAARFRVFECERDGSGKLLWSRQVKPADAEIEWTVHLANRKPIGNKFDDVGPRNPAVPPAKRSESLIIDAGAKTVTRQTSPVTLAGKFMKSHSVELGKALIDAENRLLVLGGKGKSGAVPATAPLDDFANND